MKMTRTQFKTLMKECLSELINEGMFDKHLEKLVESKQSGGFRTSSENGMLYGNSSGRSNSGTPPEKTVTGDINPRLIAAVQNVVSQSPNSKKTMLESIMMDTALHTLQNQLANGDGFGAAGALSQNTPLSQEALAHDTAQLEAMSGGNLSRWAVAAFGGKKR